VPGADALDAKLLARMVLFKNMSKMHGLLNNFLRINVSMPEENFLFSDAIDAALRQPTWP
jgi:histidinol-phosphate/aromatic aminotransferase/cobyric acid decarboxylase-like protein